ncbi:hypothetical protein GHK69_34005 [Sinorhizobium meliloti]|uniref:hypothetical protein n=1 Tax=Rhizobium meliloti TaxID=382 RepID=UPI00129584B4|nr:hypothetical protein [Sinorhizobium meliloti]MQW30254.1 hypothetical protein [Sinorhizobium meliloti]
MLELNPNDNQGIRYVLAGHLLARNDIKALKKLFKKYVPQLGFIALYARRLFSLSGTAIQRPTNWPRKRGWPTAMYPVFCPASSSSSPPWMATSPWAAKTRQVNMSKKTAKPGRRHLARSNGWRKRPGN